MTAKAREIVLPALRGVMGDWVYYCCLMNLGELSSRVQYAEEIHNNKALSDMIQRQLKKGRSAEIAAYLKNQPERFFNSLVIATYGGQPNWHELSNVRSKADHEDLKELQEDTIASVGFLTLRGDENLFALDGQHRLAGIKKAVKEGLDDDPYDDVSVIFVEHEKSSHGLERTRRLFTTLNKTARPVSKGDIIALDEDDVMAICVRRLIERTELFSGRNIAAVASNNMPVSNTTSLTTIGNLYDVLTILFTNARSSLQARRPNLQRIRPSDEKLDEYFIFAQDLFTHLRGSFEELETFFSAQDTISVVQEYRGAHGGKALFRPLGLELFTRIIARLTKDMSLEKAVEMAALLPRNLDQPPLEWLMWDSNKNTIINGHKVTLREVLLYMLGKNAKNYSEGTLLERYRRDTGLESAELPKKLV